MKNKEQQTEYAELIFKDDSGNEQKIVADKTVSEMSERLICQNIEAYKKLAE